MYRKPIFWICAAAVLGIAGTVQAGLFRDGFDTARDYVVDGTAGSGWDGFLGKGPNETVTALNASQGRPGQLYVESTLSYWSEPWTPLGPFLYKVVKGDFVATVKVTDYAGTAAAWVYHNDCGLMARAEPADAGPGEDWVAIDYFPIWSCGNFVRSADDNVRTEDGHNGKAFNLDPWLQLERQGNTFHFRTSTDGVTWTEMGASPLVRDDLANVPLQVGLAHAVFSDAVGYAAFDEFTIEGPQVVPGFKAYNPSPVDKTTDVLRDSDLTWTADATAAAHNVYFGASLDDVTNASVSNPLGVLLAEKQDANSFDLDPLEFGKTYYWRVDEVEADGVTLHRGDIWKFTVEPYSYPITNVTATASSSSSKDTGPEKTVNGSGLDPLDQHSTDGKAMWLSKRGGPQPTWIQFAFEKTYKLDKMQVWNSNQLTELDFGLGAKDVTVQYSVDANEWATLGDFEFAKATASDDYASDIMVDFTGAQAKYVKLTINSNWGGFLVQYGLSEVRFYSVPVLAREPKPAPDTTGLHPQVALGWRAGREAASHQVYLGTDPNNLPLAVTVSEPSYDMAAGLAQKYYWRVTEVNDAETPSSWASDVWSFSTADYVVVDDFESYTNQSPDRVFQAWIDGAGFSADEFFPNGGDGNGSGALVGYDPTTSDIMEKAIIHGGLQSMPLFYDNSAAPRYSEGVYTFADPQDWTKHGITTLVLYFRGASDNSPAPVYVKINGKQVMYNNGAASTTTPVWKQWNIDLASVTGANLKSVKTLAIGVGNGSSGGTGTLFIDDICLYATPPQVVTPVDPGTAGLSALYSMEGNMQDSSGKNLHGTTSGNPEFLDGMPGYGKALNFDGVSDFADLPIGPLLSTLGSSTFAVWADFTNTGGAWQRIFDFGTGTTNYMFLTAYTGNGAVRFAIRTATVGEQIVTAPAQMSTGWHHVAVVIDAASMTLRLYEDGTLVRQRPTTLLPRDLATTNQNWLGQSQYTGDAYLTGALDDFRIYNRALSESEIRYLAGDR